VPVPLTLQAPSASPAPGPIRVLLLNSEHGWRGGENQVLLLAQGLARRTDVVATTVCQPDSALAQALGQASVPMATIAMRGQVDFSAQRALRALIRSERIDIVHAHSSHTHSLAALACLGMATPLVVTRRVDFPLKRGWISRWKYIHAVARYAAVSAGVQRILVAGGVSEQAVEVIHDGIDFARFGPTGSTLRDELRLPQDAVVIGIVAHLTDHKDHSTLLHAFALVEKEAAQAWLVVVGGGELEGALKGLARDLDLQRVRFLGSRDDVPMLMRGFAVFTLSSHLEGLGSSIMDAMYCGLAVVATRAGGIPELITDEQDGLLVPVRDPQALALALLRTVQDGQLRTRLGLAAGITARNRFAAGKMVARYADLYRCLTHP
jgi:glycosyltransferase involved in cell wall biosynthesis